MKNDLIKTTTTPNKHKKKLKVISFANSVKNNFPPLFSISLIYSKVSSVVCTVGWEISGLFLNIRYRVENVLGR